MKIFIFLNYYDWISYNNIKLLSLILTHNQVSVAVKSMMIRISLTLHVHISLPSDKFS